MCLHNVLMLEKVTLLFPVSTGSLASLNEGVIKVDCVILGTTMRVMRA